MNKKKILLSVAATSMIAITGAVLAINGGIKSSSVFATNGEVWYHYAAVVPGETTHGSKEFWASSTDGCATHTFTNPGVTCEEHDFSTYESFATLTCDDDRYIPSGNESLGITPMFSTKNKTVTYGLYPQTNVNDGSLITALTGLAASTEPGTNGYYFYENAYYAKVEATPLLAHYEFNNGTTIVSGTTYWFKCEPITWTILTNDYVDADGKHLGYYLLSDVLLDAHRYDDNSNNYDYSDIRKWLNIDFCNSAFALDDSHIQTTTVDNSASTTYSSPNPYTCNNTKDKVFLPSYRDYINSSYGFSTSEDPTDTRYCKTTDWARARGAYYDNDSASYQYNNGYYWTRSPDDEYSNYAWIVSHNGILDYGGQVSLARRSVRPALTIKIA